LSARSFKKGDGTLELLDASGSIVATLVTQAQSLAGTSWNVVNINNGRQAVVGIVSDSTLTMSFDNCRPGERHNRLQPVHRRVSRRRATPCKFRTSPQRAAPVQITALAEQEQAFLRALESVATMSFEGDRLDLRQPDGALAIILVREQ
jgi:hypothetical protein